VQWRSEAEPTLIAVARVQAAAPAGETSVPATQARAPVPPIPEVEPESSPLPSPPPPELANARAVMTVPALPESPGTGKDAPLDPLARMALSMVGADPAAEEYWLAAINDPSLPAEERQDLIEDLNEDGLSDPQHPTEDDLPLILSRLRLIEDVGEEAMDEVNADAFQEAYKDLLNLARLASGGQLLKD
jgi:hypothetical protein